MSYSQALEAQLSAKRILEAEWPAGMSPREAMMRRSAHHCLRMGEAFYWSPQVSAVLEDVALTLPDNWQLHPERLPAPSGFFWFPSPLDPEIIGQQYAPDVFDAAARPPFEAIGWAPGISTQGDPGVILCGFSRDDGYLRLVQASSMWVGEPLGDLCAGMGHNENIGWAETVITIGFIKLFAAAISFLEQRIFVAPERTVERSVRRRLERDGDTREPLVRVVELRRKQARSEHSGEHEAVDWSHQWIVSGHWRQQWYPSLNANQPRWIMPYVKGPEDKPLKPPRARVFAVVR